MSDESFLLAVIAAILFPPILIFYGILAVCWLVWAIRS